MDTTGHYTVYRGGQGAAHTDIRWLACIHCGIQISILPYRRRGDKSGQGRYNRCRAAMVQHLHEKHRDQLATTAKSRTDPS